MLRLANILSSLARYNQMTSKAMENISSQHTMSTATSGAELTDMVKSIVPVLTHDLHKGQCGRIGVVGGCKEYTGAPYFGAISALKVGADLAHVFCTEGAAPVIKSYSPELIVHPILDSPAVKMEIDQWLPRMHSLVIGPGLGRDPKLLDNVKGFVTKARELSLPLVLDADAVFLISQDPSLISGYTAAILTPNAVEFSRLFQAVIGSKPPSDDEVTSVRDVSTALGHVTIVRKGGEDVISDGRNMLVCSAEGSPRRCGGQGDLLAGSMGVLTYWAHSTDADNAVLAKLGPTLCAAYGACLLTRECAHVAYEKHGRSTTTTNMIEQVHLVFDRLYG